MNFPSSRCPVCGADVGVPILFPRVKFGESLPPGAKCDECGWQGQAEETVKKERVNEKGT